MASVHSIHVNPRGGVPKTDVPEARMAIDHVEGDRQRNTKFHGGPQRAVCLFGLEIIRQLQSEGHPITPGSAGENLTLAGLDWSTLTPGVKLRVGEAELEITSYCKPCRTICASFTHDNFMRIYQDDHPGWSRLYARVLREGLVRTGDAVTVMNRVALP